MASKRPSSSSTWRVQVQLDCQMRFTTPFRVHLDAKCDQKRRFKPNLTAKCDQKRCFKPNLTTKCDQKRRFKLDLAVKCDPKHRFNATYAKPMKTKCFYRFVLFSRLRTRFDNHHRIESNALLFRVRDNLLSKDAFFKHPSRKILP